MRQDQLEHAIRTACQIIGMHEVIVVGSQSILGTFREDRGRLVKVKNANTAAEVATSSS